MGALLAALVILVTACGSGGEGTSEEGTSAQATENGSEEASETPEFEERELTMASWYAPDTFQGAAINWWIEELAKRTGGAVTVKTYWSESLLGAAEIANGVRDGRVDLGHFCYCYTPGDFPLSTVVEVPFMGDNIGAQVTALNELYKDDEAYRNEWESGGIKLLSHNPVQPALVGAPEPIGGLDWFQGKSIRASGFFAEALKKVGASPVSLPVGDTYEAMQRGTIDAYGSVLLDSLGPLSLLEVGKHVVDPGLGHFVASAWTISQQTWDSMEPELQAVIEEISAAYPEKLIEASFDIEDKNCQAIKEAGGTLTKLSEADTQRWRELVGESGLDSFVQRASAAGVDGRAFWEKYDALYQEAAEGAHADYVSGVDRCIESLA
ncbi:MAG TPA: C4-dicarboxylate TRAP transporter substrate-binding protein [Egibacteraceae bacterium]|nr:C4-dicarboxylate TRAP transporter substrate-binding protein [Egibacteraceae bacterium]